MYDNDDLNIPGLPNLPSNNPDLGCYPHSNRYCHTICLQYSLQVTATQQNIRQNYTSILFSQIEAADRLEAIRDEYNLTETEPIPDQVIINA